MKLCLFIDGLDEYEGLEVDIARLFTGVVLSPHLKVCASSRPHIPFEDAFATRAKLRLQDLTHSDIRQFIEDRLVRDEMMETLAAREPEQCQDLVRHIAREAQGVFLWVVLVVSSLINGLGKHDGISELQTRLKALPKNLDELYYQMIMKVEDIYKQDASRLFQLVAEAVPKPGDWRAAEILSVYTLSIAMKQSLDLTKEMESRPLDSKKLTEACKRMDIVLKNACGGLLEIQFGKFKTTTPLPSMKVTYLHRTVKDFLESGEYWQEIVQRTSDMTNGDTFIPSVAIFKSMVLQIQHTSNYEGQRLIDQALTFIRRVDTKRLVTSTAFRDLFDQFNRVATTGRYISVGRATEGQKLENSLLDYAITTPENLDLMSLLLILGADPNEHRNGKPSPWQNALTHILFEHSSWGSDEFNGWGAVVRELLEHEADPLTSCQGPERFEIRGRQKRKISTGNTWSVAQVIATAFEEAQFTNINSAYLGRVRKEAVLRWKQNKKKTPPRASPVKIIPEPKQTPQNRRSGITESITEIEAASSFKHRSCCLQ